MWTLNPLFRIRFGDPLQCDLFFPNRTVVLPSPDILKLLAALNKPMPRAAVVALATWALEVDTAAARRAVAELIRNDILVPDDRDFAAFAGARHWIERGWLDALMLHLASRDIPFEDDRSAEPDRSNSDQMRRIVADEGPPEFWADYPGRPRVELPPANGAYSVGSLGETLLRRRSNRPWRSGMISMTELSTILHRANAEARELRTAAEARYRDDGAVLLNSAFCATETYIVAFNVASLPAGLYHYDLRDHALVQLREGLFRQHVVEMCIGQSRPRDAACAFVITVRWARYMYRYRHPRAYRTLLINVGELAQKYILLSTAFNLSTFLTPALRDECADSLLGVDGHEEAALYVVAAG